MDWTHLLLWTCKISRTCQSTLCELFISFYFCCKKYNIKWMLILMPLIPALSHAEIPKQIPKHLLKYQLKWRNSKKTILNTYRMYKYSFSNSTNNLSKIYYNFGRWHQKYVAYYFFLNREMLKLPWFIKIVLNMSW